MKAFLLLAAFAVPAAILSALAAWAGCGPSRPAAQGNQPDAPASAGTPILIKPAVGETFYVQSAAAAPAQAPATAGVVNGLTAILARTKSKDTFTLTVLALGHLGADARSALPDIIENAERLGVLEGAFAQGGSKSVHGEVVLEAVEAIATGAAPQAQRGCCHTGCCTGPACPITSDRCCGFQVMPRPDAGPQQPTSFILEPASVERGTPPLQCEESLLRERIRRERADHPR
jgi:hypothetical protein